MKKSSLLWIHEPQQNPEIPDLLKFDNLSVKTASNDSAVPNLLRTKRFAVILYDCHEPNTKDLERLQAIVKEAPESKVILLVSESGVEFAIHALSHGIYQFLQKPIHNDHLRATLINAAKSHESTLENELLREQVQSETQQEYILGQSPAMQKIWITVKKIAPSDVPILIEGETGTGKEIVAHAIFENSLRREGPFVAMNCAALSKELIESELFGHVRGAFTGAVENKKGRFEMADGGTLFLDEIGEIPIELQSKLLRVLQDGSFQRVGDTVTRQVNVRILAATNRDLKAAILNQKFREDLYFRLNVVHIYLPPLRKRREDIKDLIEFFIARITTKRGQERVRLSPESENFLLHYHYPGNIRELENMLERASLLCSQGEIHLGDILTPVSFQQYQKRDAKESPQDVKAEPTNLSEARDQFEMYHLMQLLTLAKGNISLAARLAGIHRNNFKEKMKKFGLQSMKFKD